MSELFRFTLARPSEQVSAAILVGPELKGKTLTEIRQEVPAINNDVDFNSVASTLKHDIEIKSIDVRLKDPLPPDEQLRSIVVDAFKNQDLENVLNNAWPHDEKLLDRALIQSYLFGRDRFAAGPKLTRYRQLYDLVRQVVHQSQGTEKAPLRAWKPLVFPFASRKPLHTTTPGETRPPEQPSDEALHKRRLGDYTEILTVLSSNIVHKYLIEKERNDEGSDTGGNDVDYEPVLDPAWTRSLSASAKRALSDDFPGEQSNELQTLYSTTVKLLQEEENYAQAAVSELKFHSLNQVGIRTNGKVLSPWRTAAGASRSEIPWVPERLPSLMKPSGVGNLLVVRSHIMRYEGGEIYHIENVLKGETFTHEVKKLDRIETTVTTTEEETKEETRESSATDRFSLNNEASEVIKENKELKAGLSLSGKYGPTVEFKADTSFAQTESSEQANKVASEFAKDVTSRAAAKVVNKMSRSKTVVTVQEHQDNLSHAFEGGGYNISGIYQWVNKVVQSQIYDYGIRLLFDVIIPEPAAFLIEAMTSSKDAVARRPPDLTVSAAYIHEGNYTTLAALYGASAIEPPPPLLQSFSVAFSAETKSQPPQAGPAHFHQDIQIPPGFVAYSATVVFNLALDFGGPNVTKVELAFSIGEKRPAEIMIHQDPAESWNKRRHFTFLHPLPRDQVGLAVSLWRCLSVSGTIRLNCIRTADGFRSWQHKTYDSLYAAHKMASVAYERTVADAALMASRKYNTNFNPDEAKRMIRNELKKACISMLTQQHFAVFDGLQRDGAHDIVETNVAKALAQGAYIQFFEQVFEWDQLQYSLYPYYWARKATWKDRVFQESTDPDMADFLRAGAARVHFGAAKNFWPDVIFFLQKGEIWGGGPTPGLVNEDYLPIAKELANAQERPGVEVPVGEAWETRVPTSLVRLRDEEGTWTWDANGPKWEKDPVSGYWKEVH